MNNTIKTGANLQHPLSTGESAPKVPFCNSSEFKPKDGMGFFWHKGNSKLIEEHKEKCMLNAILRELKESKYSLVGLNKHLEQATKEDQVKINQELKEGLELLYFVLDKISTKLDVEGKS